MWKGRFEEDTAAAMLDFSQSLDLDWRLYDCDITGSIAHARMLAKVGIITFDEARSIENTLEEIRSEIARGEFEPKIELEDVHMNIEARLSEKIGAVGAKLHTGRSRNDQVATTVRLFLRGELLSIASGLTSLLETIYERANAHYNVIIPGYTHLQQAQPITMGHYWLAHFEAFERDFKRLLNALDALDECPLGAGALAGSTMPLDRLMTAELLGFSRVSRNSLDSVAQRDYMADYHYFASLFAAHVSRLSEDFVIYSSQEFGWLVLPDAFCTGSSMMPQKKNPDAVELLRGRTGQIYGHIIDLLVMLKGAPMTYDRDLQEDKRGLFESVATVKKMLSILIPLLSRTEVNAKRARESLERGQGCALATDVAEYLVTKGVPFRDAHWKVGKLVRFCIDNNKRLDELTIDEWREHIPEVQNDILDKMSLDVSVAARMTVGGTAPEQVLMQAKDARTRIDAYNKELARRCARSITLKISNSKSESAAEPQVLNNAGSDASVYIGHFDGASRGNPGSAGAGAWFGMSDNDEPVWESAEPLGIRTNNEAEYTALINLLTELKSRGVKHAEIRGDSKLVIEQMSGRWKVNEPRLRTLNTRAKELQAGMDVKYIWVPRERNKRADALSNKAMDS